MVEDPLQLLRIKCVADEQGDGVLGNFTNRSGYVAVRAVKVWKCFIEVASESVETGAVDDITYLPVVARGLGYNYSITQTHSSHDASWHNTDLVLRARNLTVVNYHWLFYWEALLNRRESISQAFTTPWSRCRKLGCASISALISVFRYQIKHTFLCLIYTSDRLCNLCNVHDGMQVILVHRRGGEGAAVYKLTRAIHVAVPMSCTHPRTVHSQLTVASSFYL